MLSLIDKAAKIYNNIIGQIKLKSEFIILLAAIVTVCAFFIPSFLLRIKWVLKRKLKLYQFRALGINVNEDTKKSLKYYVPTRGQNIDPCNEEEMADGGPCFSRELIPFLMQNNFENNKNRYSIILADSGMGKTTFLYSLFFSYYKKIMRKHNIRFVSLYSGDALKKIEKIHNKFDTILLLDGLDENKKAMEDCEKFLKKIIDKTCEFHTVIITCRTQFFENEKDEPGYINAFSGNMTKKKIRFEKIYLSPFNDKEIDTYLKKKYNFFWNKGKVKQAKKIVDNCPKLMVRPMLLAYMDDLISDTTVEYKYTYEIYDKLVKKWIEREGNEALNDFSEKVAEKMYQEGTIYINIKEIEKVCQEYNIKIKSIEAKSRSLLNRNSKGNYKFSHKSILEFILAQKAYGDEAFRRIVIHNGFDGYDMIILFLKEMCEHGLHMLLQKNSAFIENVSFSFSPMNYTEFNNITFLNCCFERSFLACAKFNYTKLNYVNFKDADLRCVHFDGVTFENVNLNGANLSHAIFKKIKLHDVDLRGANLENADLSELDLRNVDLKRAILNNAVLRGANLEGANLESANLRYADLSRVSLRGANLKNADLKGANLSGSDVCKANLQGADLSGVNMKTVCIYNFASKRSQLELMNADRIDLEIQKECVKEIRLENANLDRSVWMIDHVKMMIFCFKEANFTYIFVRCSEGQKVIYKSKLINYIENIM